MSQLKNKTILVTGGTGSFGQKFVEIVLKKHNPKAIRVFSNEEFFQWDMEKKFGRNKLRFILGDIRDKVRIDRAMNGVDIVVHAAALKQIPVIEYSPIEAVKTNIIGTENVIDAAIDNNVSKAMFISSDKAVNPINLYGATKLCGEKLFVQANSYVGKGQTKLSCVRYGNVVGSRGSVVPLFSEQSKSGVLTITDKRMTRFWITLEGGVNFVINCIEMMQGGEIFVPKIPSMKVMDLVKVIAPDAKLKMIGIRPGEKLHEVLLIPEESKRTREFKSYFVIEPEFSFWKKSDLKGGKYLPEDFRYSSDSNKEWLTVDAMKDLLKKIEIEK